MILSIVDIQAYWRLFLILENKLTGEEVFKETFNLF